MSLIVCFGGKIYTKTMTTTETQAQVRIHIGIIIQYYDEVLDGSPDPKGGWLGGVACGGLGKK